MRKARRISPATSETATFSESELELLNLICEIIVEIVMNDGNEKQINYEPISRKGRKNKKK